MQHNAPKQRRLRARISSLKGLGLALTCVIGAAGLTACTGQKEESPNILLITTDDLGVQVGAYGMEQAKTPHIDALASQGMRFTNAYVTQASCSPSRSSIFTGLYPHQNGQIGLSHTATYQMHKGLATLPKVLDHDGYHTGVIGKVHVQPSRAFPFDYRAMGGGKAHDTQDVARVAELARQYIQGRQEDQRFFLMVNYFDPHRPYKRQVKGVPETPLYRDQVKPFEFLGIDTPRLREGVAGYLNGVKRADEGLGQLLSVLRETGHHEDTVVIFIGDQGPPFGRSKVTNYEAGLKIPFIVRWPGVTKGGTVSEELISTVDIVPTLAEAAGADWPNRVAGESLRPLLAGKNVAWRDALFAEYNAHTQEQFFPRRSVRVGQYKLIVNVLHERSNPATALPPAIKVFKRPEWRDTQVAGAYARWVNPPRIELYDLENDPWEMKNLAGSPKYADVQKRLLQRLREWQQRTHDYLLREGDYHKIRVGEVIPGQVSR